MLNLYYALNDYWHVLRTLNIDLDRFSMEFVTLLALFRLDKTINFGGYWCAMELNQVGSFYSSAFIFLSSL